MIAQIPRVVRSALSALALALLAAASLAQSSGGALRPPINGVTHVEPGWHAIVHARLTTDPGTVIDNATIVVKSGAIVSVEAGGTPPAGARVWDATGLDVYPGLVEPYLQVDVPRPDKPANAGAHWNPRITPERSALDAPGAPGVPADVRKKLRSMGYGAALIAPSSGAILRGSVALVSLSEPGDASAPGVEPIISRLNAQCAAFDTAAVGGFEYPGSKMGTIAVIRQALADAQWQQAAVLAFSRNPGTFERPVFSRALEPLRQPVGWLFDAGEPLDIWRFVKIIREFRGDERVIAIGTGAEYQHLEAIKSTGAAVVVPLAFPKRPRIATAADRDSVGLNELMAWEQAPTNPRRLDAAGIMTAITASKLPRGSDFMENLRDAVGAGLSKDKALAMVTTHPAGLMGMSERLGKVAPGFIANFIVMKGDFFSPKREIRDVWIDGQRHEINPAPLPTAEAVKGEWTLALATTPALTLTMTIGEKNEVSLSRPVPPATPAAAPAAESDKKPEPKKPASTKAKGVVQMENRLDFAVAATTLDPNAKPEEPPPAKPAEGTEGKEETKPAEKPADKSEASPAGAALVSLILENAPASPSMRGVATLPTGERLAISATRNPPKDTDKKSADEKKDDDKPKPALVSIPEALTTPFGAYGLASIPTQDSVLIKNATVWTNTDQGIIENASVHIAGGKVRAVGKSPLTIDPAFPITREIDAKGLHVTAGIIDCHSHTGISGGVNEGTQSCTAEVRIFDVINPTDIDWYRELAGGVTGANQLHGSANAIGGQNSVVKLRWGSATPDDMRLEGATPGIKFALGENVKQANWGDNNTTRYPQTRMGVETFIRDRFLAAKAYKARWEAFMALLDNDKANVRPPERDLELEALVEILEGKRLIHCHSYRQDEILMLCRVANEFGFRIGTFQHVLEGYKVADAIKASALGGSTFSDWWAYKWEVYDAIPSNGSIMHDVGVVVSFNSDSDELARRLNAEAGKAVKYGGVPRAEALKFVTLNPAKQLKIESMTGSIEAGKDADIAVWSGDPLSPTTRCVRTFVDGRELFSLEQDKAHRDRVASERARILQKLLADPPKKEGDKPEADGASGGGPGGPGGPGRRGRNAPPPSLDEDDLSAGGTTTTSRSGLFTLVPAGGEDDEIARAQAAYRARQIEARMEYLLRNGIDPNIGRPGVCGCDL